MPKTIAIIQSNYIPWKGYLDIIRRCDEFVLYDEVQYTRNDWRNRNRIKTSDGVRWLSIPVKVKGRYYQRIDEAEIQDAGWAAEHLKTLYHAYRRAACFDAVYPRLAALYERAASETMLSQVNYLFLRGLCDMLGIQTPLTWSVQYASSGTKSEKLASICASAGATTYLSGPAAQAYLDPAEFTARGVEVRYMSYEGYPEYPQLYPPFEHAVSVVDLLFNTGDDAPRYLLPWP